MYDRVIWPENYDPKTSAIYALNDIDVKPMKIRIIIAATCAALAFSMAGPVSAHDGEAITVTKNFEAAIPNILGKSLIAVEVNFAPGAASAPHTHARVRGAWTDALVTLRQANDAHRAGRLLKALHREGDALYVVVKLARMRPDPATGPNAG